MRSPLPGLVVACATFLLSACATAPVTALVTAEANPTPRYIAMLREEARRADGVEFVPQVRLRWRYVAALAPNDPEATQRIRELDEEIGMRSAALVEEGNADLRRGRITAARLAFLKALALDGENAEARRQLSNLDERTELVRQERQNERAREALEAGTENPAGE